MQSAYDFAIINDWDGTTTMDDGVVMSSVVAAGKIGTDNTFSGIIMGEVFGGNPKDNSEAKEEAVLGLYGVSNG